MATREKAGRRPNIVWIMADDLSWGDLGCFGQKRIRTPNLDRLAAEGMRFTHCYSGSTVCAPSRSCLMQGLHQGHASVRDNMRKFEGGQYRPSLRADDVTVARLLRDAGYATGLFGKWGLALQGDPGAPNPMGFDEFFGYLNQRKAHNYYPVELWHNDRRVEIPENAGHHHTKPNEYDAAGRIVPNGVADPSKAKYSFDLYAARALDFVRANRDRPFFLYLAYTIPHGAHEVPELGPYKNEPWPLPHRVYAAMVSRLDAEVGKLRALLKEEGLDRRTLIFFVSDNGYSFRNQAGEASLDETFRHCGPWKGVKGHLDQGGVRVPALAWWPGKIAAGSVSDHIWAFWDFLPTACEIVGAAVPKTCDGISLLPVLTGDAKRQRKHAHLYWEYRDEQAARIGGYWACYRHPSDPVRVFDAEQDPRQTRDLAAEKPDVARRAKEIFASAHTPTPQTPSPGETDASWAARRRKAGLTLVNNVDV